MTVCMVYCRISILHKADQGSLPQTHDIIRRGSYNADRANVAAHGTFFNSHLQGVHDTNQMVTPCSGQWMVTIWVHPAVARAGERCLVKGYHPTAVLPRGVGTRVSKDPSHMCTLTT